MNTLAAKAAARTVAGGTGAKAASGPPAPKDGFAALTKYIPTESVTLYVAWVSAQAALTSVVSWLTPAFGYVALAVLTPVFQLLLYWQKVQASHGNWREVPWREWPWWNIFASLVAFLVWAMAVPGNPIIDVNDAAKGVVAALAAVFVSTVLNLVGSLNDK
jgi:hypothetical protein